MTNFIKKIFDGKNDESVHSKFIRFGKGDYRGRFLISLNRGSKIKIKTSFEFANDLASICSKFGDCKVSGIVLSKEDISNIMSQNNIEGNSETKKGGLYYQNNISSQELKGKQLEILEKASYSAMLDVEGDGFSLKTKKKLPKPGKDEKKIDDKFCQMEIDVKYLGLIREDFFWDMPEAKKISVSHQVIINQIEISKGEKDFAKARESAKRIGKIIRIANVDGKEIRKEIMLRV